MKEGVSQYWTPGLEETFEKALAVAKDFAGRYSITSVRNALKYDQRSKASRKAKAQLQDSLAGATDEDLAKLAKLEAWALHGEGRITRDETRVVIIKILARLVKQRAEILDRLATLHLVKEAGQIVRGSEFI